MLSLAVIRGKLERLEIPNLTRLFQVLEPRCEICSNYALANGVPRHCTKPETKIQVPFEKVSQRMTEDQKISLLKNLGYDPQACIREEIQIEYCQAFDACDS